MRNLSNDLSFPPRSTALPVQLSVLFGGFNNQFGWIFTTVGLMMFAVTMGGLDVTASTDIPFFVPLIALVFLFIGVYFLRKGINTGLLARYLMINGELTTGKVVSREKTNTHINDVPVIIYTLEYKADNTLYRITERTHLHSRFEGDAEEPILFDPRNPQDAMAIDVLPLELEVGRDGTLHFDGGGGLVRLAFQLFIPFICILIITTYVAWELGYLLPVNDDIHYLFPDD